MNPIIANTGIKKEYPSGIFDTVAENKYNFIYCYFSKANKFMKIKDVTVKIITDIQDWNFSDKNLTFIAMQSANDSFRELWDKEDDDYWNNY